MKLTEGLSWFFDPADLGGFRKQTAQKDANEQNVELAQKVMDFQERMSSTAYQRARLDMEKAGFNPILAARQPASTPSGSQATVQPEDQMAQSMSALPGKVLGAMTGGMGLAATAANVANAKKDLDVKNSAIQSNISAAGAAEAQAGLATARAMNETEGLRSTKARAMVDEANATSARSRNNLERMRNEQDTKYPWLDFFFRKIGIGFGASTGKAGDSINMGTK